DTFATASKIALENGITTLVAFATQEKNESLMERMRISIAKGTGKSHCDYSFHFSPTSFSESDWRDIENLAGRGFKTMKLYTTYHEAGLYTDWNSMKEIMSRCSELGIRILIHCEAENILKQTNRNNQDASNPFTHSLARPEEAEIEAVENVISLADETNAQVHIVHVSSDRTAALLATVRGDGSITCETAPHYLLLNNGKLKEKNGHRFLCTPPLRDEKTRQMMEYAVFAEDIDLYATDHCAFLKNDKDCFNEDYRKVPMGLAGVGALVPNMYELIVKTHGKPLGEFATRLSLNPAKVAGLYPRKGSLMPGADADIVILNQEGPERSVVSTFADSYETFPDRTTSLEIMAVLLRGRVVVQNGGIISEDRPNGECVWSLK
ncbi:amidohydrolase family protein, partial [PVC group bacterium]|nr:amidohydrolase family protein [PVC group bacterium]